MRILQNLKTAFVALVTLAGIGTAQAQKTGEATQTLLAGKSYVFKAQTALPMRGSSRQLTSNYYELKITKDSIKSFLPFFGRAYSAPMNSEESGIQFTSTSFVYSEKEKKKGGWDVQIKPKDTKDVRQMLLNISSTGFATLQVISNTRETISFTGRIEETR